MKYTLKHLESLTTICTGHADDLKIDNSDTRVWLSRCGVEDGEPYPNKVTVERLFDGEWVVDDFYQAVES